MCQKKKITCADWKYWFCAKSKEKCFNGDSDWNLI